MSLEVSEIARELKHQTLAHISTCTHTHYSHITIHPAAVHFIDEIELRIHFQYQFIIKEKKERRK